MPTAGKLYRLKLICQGAFRRAVKASMKLTRFCPGAAQLAQSRPNHAAKTENAAQRTAFCLLLSGRIGSYLCVPDAIRISLYAQKFIGTSV